MENMINIMVVEDSNFMRINLKEKLSEITDFSVEKVVRNGLEALKVIRNPDEKVDVVLLDLLMPEMDGIETLEHIMSEKPIPTAIFTGVTKDQENGEFLYDALELGALGIVQKPTGHGNMDLDHVMENLENKIKAAHSAREKLEIFLNYGKTQKIPQSKKENESSGSKRNFTKQLRNIDLFIIGASTGGPIEVASILKQLSFNPELIGVVVQHIPEGFEKYFSKKLDKLTDFKITVAKDGEKLKAGKIYLAPGNKHIKFDGTTRRAFIKLTDEERVWGVRPCIDFAFVTAAQIFHQRLLGIILTGMGKDGTFGVRVIKEYGGICIAQDPDEAMIDAMPKNAIKSGNIDQVYTLEEIINCMNSETSS